MRSKSPELWAVMLLLSGCPTPMVEPDLKPENSRELASPGEVDFADSDVDADSDGDSDTDTDADADADTADTGNSALSGGSGG